MSPSMRSVPLLRAWRTIPGPPRDRIRARLVRLYAGLERQLGPQDWWPGRTPYEVAVGAILTQHTAWSNAARAIERLRAHGVLVPAPLAALSEGALAELVRPAGTYRLKARRVLAFTRWLLDRFGGRFEGLRRAPLAALRRDLLAVPGLGPETTDAILLYAAGRPVFVADAYARRILSRHRLLSSAASYEEARAFIEAHLPSDPALFNEYHALLVAAGKAYCRPTPRCEACPVRADLKGRPPARG